MAPTTPRPSNVTPVKLVLALLLLPFVLWFRYVASCWLHGTPQTVLPQPVWQQIQNDHVKEMQVMQQFQEEQAKRMQNPPK
jgi:hypothetical protein